MNSLQNQLCFFIKWRVFITENMNLTLRKHGMHTKIWFEVLMEEAHLRDQDTCGRIMLDWSLLSSSLQEEQVLKNASQGSDHSQGHLSTGFLGFHLFSDKYWDGSQVPICQYMLLMQPFRFKLIKGNCLSMEAIKLLGFSYYLALFTKKKCMWSSHLSVN